MSTADERPLLGRVHMLQWAAAFTSWARRGQESERGAQPKMYGKQVACTGQGLLPQGACVRSHFWK